VSGKYALFIWGSYALTAAVLLWNAFAPKLRRNELKRRLSEGVDEAGDEE
jgi:heme exporter protein CcmD